MKKINLKQFLFCILIPVSLGFLVGLVSNSASGYNNLTLPPFSPPGWLFPIVWTVLYILMGISSYLVLRSDHLNKEKALLIYIAQLAVNLIWPILFFNLELLFFSFIWIILLIFLVIYMIYSFYKINKTSGLIQIPYLLWLLFAALLNFSIYTLN